MAGEPNGELASRLTPRLQGSFQQRRDITIAAQDANNFQWPHVRIVDDKEGINGQKANRLRSQIAPEVPESGVLGEFRNGLANLLLNAVGGIQVVRGRAVQKGDRPVCVQGQRQRLCEGLRAK